MKKISISLILFCFFGLFFLHSKDNQINSLNWIEVYDTGFAPQVMLDFANPLYFEKKIDKDKLLVEFSFPGMNQRDFDKLKVISKIKALKKVVKDVFIETRKVPCPRVVLTIVFSKPDVLIKWNKMEDPNRLILDIFLKNSLKSLNNKDSVLLYAKNNSIVSDIPIKSQKKKDLRIVVDAGHGGSDPGANGFFLLKEKDLTLDISRRVNFLLKKNGLNVFLTRNSDKDLTLQERIELADQLKADLFVSIHVNAAAGVESANGIESYFLRKESVALSKNGGYLFVFNNADKSAVKKIENYLTKNIDLSKSLSTCIQDSVCDFFKEKNIDLSNRGVKQNMFRVLLCSQVPVALIEVGFLTNKKEAARLANVSYRQMLAQGISNGIKKYVYSQNLL